MKHRKVLFISADQWRGECLSALGHPCVRTPNLDRLAARGVLFRNHFAQCSPCGPSRTSMLTGLYLMNHRSGRNGTPLDARHTNLALETRKAGFDPVLFGYSDTSVDPRQYDRNDPILTTYEGVMPGFSVGLQLDDRMAAWIADLKKKGYELPDGRRGVYRPVPDYPGAASRGHTFRPPVFSAEDSETSFMANAALEYMRMHREEDWFMHLVFLRPHPPIIAPEPYNAMYDPNDVPMPKRAASPEDEAAQHPYQNYLLSHQREIGWYSEHFPADLREIDEREVRQLRATYYGMISQVDDQIGRILDHLSRTGEDRETLIIFTCDHGEMLGDHWMWGKEGYFDRAYHIPMIVADPAAGSGRTRGLIDSRFTEAIDIVPTILDWLGLPIPANCDGRSLMPILAGETPADWRCEAHWEYDYRDVVDQGPEQALGISSDECTLSAIRNERFKYVHFPALPSLLFDLANDPDELHNLADDPDYRAVRLDMAERMLSWRMRHAERTLSNILLTESGPIERGNPRHPVRGNAI
jgi:arylsulfatase A-like enzyme